MMGKCIWMKKDIYQNIHIINLIKIKLNTPKLFIVFKNEIFFIILK